MKVITTAANTSDTTQIIPLVEKAGLPEETMILADKGYTSQKNRTALKGLKLEDGIMHKATRGKPLTESHYSLLIGRFVMSFHLILNTLSRKS